MCEPKHVAVELYKVIDGHYLTSVQLVCLTLKKKASRCYETSGNYSPNDNASTSKRLEPSSQVNFDPSLKYHPNMDPSYRGPRSQILTER
jgi:hypothetical protein